MRGDVGEVVVMCGGCFFVVCAWMCGLFLGRVWVWADFVMCDRRGGFMRALFACIACIFYRRGTSARGGTQKAHNVYYV